MAADFDVTLMYLQATRDGTVGGAHTQRIVADDARDAQREILRRAEEAQLTVVRVDVKPSTASEA